MYKDYFRLTEMPFSIAPDPRFLYMSARHREALSHLLYGVQGEGGIVLLTGEAGTGKTTLCRCLLDQLPGRCSVAFILNPKMNVEELLAAICDEFDIDVPGHAGRVKVFIDVINAYLLRANAISIGGFIREGASGMVAVNDRLVREGDEVMPGLRVEKIQNDSVVFNCKGRRFVR